MSAPMHPNRVEVGFDLETHMGAKGGFPRPVCGSFAVYGRKGTLLRPDQLEAIVAEPDAVMVGHNLCGFDLPVIAFHLPHLLPHVLDALKEGRVVDTMTVELLLDYAEGVLRRKGDGYGLGDTAKRYGLAGKADDEWRTRYGELDGVPFSEWPEKARTYAEEDAVVPLDVWRCQQRRAQALSYSLPTLALECRAAFCLAIASNVGVRVDEDAATKAAAEQQVIVDAHLPTLMQNGLVRANGTKDDNAVRAMVEHMLGGNVPPNMRTGTGKVKADADTISTLPPHPVVDTYRKYLKATKRQQFIVDLKRRAPRVFPQYRSLGARSSRTSCAQPNFQQIPKMATIRAIMAADLGGCLILGDFSTQEMRTFAETCLAVVGWSAIADALRRDPNCDMHQILGDNMGTDRQTAKSANFAFLGGMGSTGFIRYCRKNGLHFDQSQAKAIRDGVLRTWTEAPRFFDYVKSITHKARRMPVVLPTSGYMRGDCFYTDACNLHFQGLAAHASKHALWMVTLHCLDARLGSPLLGCLPSIFVHDEVGVSAPWPPGSVEAEAARVEIERVMMAAHAEVTPNVPSKVEAEVARSWGG